MGKQQEFEIIDSNITKISFVKCENCEENVICPHYGFKEGCRTKEIVKEIKLN